MATVVNVAPAAPPRIILGGRALAAVGALTPTPPKKSGNPLGLPTWVLVLGALGLIAVVWYVTSGKKGGRSWKRRRPF
jgi:O-antigen/teichoic acid export membrane protein